jgi:hypothetical protein
MYQATRHDYNYRRGDNPARSDSNPAAYTRAFAIFKESSAQKTVVSFLSPVILQIRAFPAHLRCN